MAVPAEFTILDISGKFILNKTLTDPKKTDEILSLQGVGWLKRKAIASATVTLTIKHYKGDDGQEHIDIDQTLTGGIPGTREERTLDWEAREKEDGLFGHIIGKSRRVKIEEVDSDEAFLKEGWTEDTLEKGVIQANASSNTPKSGTTWAGVQVWGIEVINGERRYARHVDFIGPKGEHVQHKMYYDYLGPL